MLFREAYQHGAEKKRLVVRLAGGASVVDDHGVFNIGKRELLRRCARSSWKAGAPVHGEEAGGTISRTVRLDSASGRMMIRPPGEAEREIRAQTGRDGGSRRQNA